MGGVLSSKRFVSSGILYMLMAKIPSADNIGEAIRDGIIAKLKDELYT